LLYVASLVFDAAARSPELRELRGGDAVSAVLSSLLRFEKTSALWSREFDFLGELVSRTRIVEARRSHDVSADAMAGALLHLLTEEAR
jgi:hypothetical protein